MEFHSLEPPFITNNCYFSKCRMFPVRFVISFFTGLLFNVATYSKSSNLVFDVLIYLLKFGFDPVHDYSPRCFLLFFRFIWGWIIDLWLELDIFYQITDLFETGRAVINSWTDICSGKKDVKLDRSAAHANHFPNGLRMDTTYSSIKLHHYR